MTYLNHLKQAVTASALVVALISGTTTLASAHSINACIEAVRDFCDTAHGAGSAAALACRQSGAIQCPNHSHPGKNPGLMDPNLSADPGHQVYKKNKRFKLHLR